MGFPSPEVKPGASGETCPSLDNRSPWVYTQR
jgi:hypothetical protein